MENLMEIGMENGIKINFGETYWMVGRLVNGKKILENRLVVITKNSKVKGYYNGHLINPKNGLPQKTLISIPMDLVVDLVPSMESPVVEESLVV